MTVYEHIKRLEEWLRRDGDAPQWEGIVIAENYFIGSEENPTKIPAPDLQSVDAYAARFEEILRRGYSWVNLVGNGLLGEKLLVTVEYPKQTCGASMEQVSVNLSGPYSDKTGQKSWNIEHRIRVV